IYVANGYAGLGIVEAPSLVHSNLLANKNTKDNIWAITSQNGYTYVSNGKSGVKVFKTNPSWDPDPVSEILNDPNDKPNKDHLFTYTFVNGNMIYLADKTEFEAWEWNPDSLSPPKFKGGFTKLQDTIMSIFVQGNFAYIANFLFGAQSLNITNPGKIAEGGYIFSEGLAYDIIVDSNKLAYLANDQEGLWIVDFQNPYQPVEKSKLGQYEFAHSLEKYDDHIYMTNGSRGIEIINVNNPSTPHHIDTIDYTDFLKEQGIEAPFNDFLKEIDIEYPFLYTAGDYQGIWINYISYIPGFPPKVTPIDFISLPYGASAVKSDGERLYLSDDFKNFYVFYPPMYSPKHILVDSSQITGNKITFKLTQDIPAGSYDIFVISDSGIGRLERAINVYKNKVAFYPGLNILSYPGSIPLENSQAFYLLKNLSSQEASSDLKIKNIWTKKKGAVSESFQLAYINQENNPAGDNFDIVPLSGYLLYFQGAQKKEYFLPTNIINMTNTELLKRLKSEIVQGQNIISMPLINESTIKSSDLISQESQPAVISVQEWDVAQGKWHAGYSFFNTVNGNVKNLSGGHGYLVSVP
ncbi:MAG: LVIVD repeat-containing protein, partial [bacterium]